MGPALSKSAVSHIILPFTSAGSANVCELSIKETERVIDFLTRHACSHIRVNFDSLLFCSNLLRDKMQHYSIFLMYQCAYHQRDALVVGRARKGGREGVDGL